MQLGDWHMYAFQNGREEPALCDIPETAIVLFRMIGEFGRQALRPSGGSALGVPWSAGPRMDSRRSGAPGAEPVRSGAYHLARLEHLLDQLQLLLDKKSDMHLELLSVDPGGLHE